MEYFSLKMWTSVPMVKVNVNKSAKIQMEVIFAAVLMGSPWRTSIFVKVK
jgi:hypothetical protein